MAFFITFSLSLDSGCVWTCSSSCRDVSDHHDQLHCFHLLSASQVLFLRNCMECRLHRWVYLVDICRLTRMKSKEPRRLVDVCCQSRLFELHAGWSFGVQAGKIACRDFTNPKAGLDFKHSLKDWITGQARDDTVFGSGGTCFGADVHYFLSFIITTPPPHHVIMSPFQNISHNHPHNPL